MPKLKAAAKPSPWAVVVASPYLHDEADHRRFKNDDGTMSVICLCLCPDCWPPDGSPCPDSTVPC